MLANLSLMVEAVFNTLTRFLIFLGLVATDVFSILWSVLSWNGGK